MILGVIYKVPNMGDDGRDGRYFLSRSLIVLTQTDFTSREHLLQRNDTKEIPYPHFLDFEQEFNLVGTEGGVPLMVEKLNSIYTVFVENKLKVIRRILLFWIFCR